MDDNTVDDTAAISSVPVRDKEGAQRHDETPFDTYTFESEAPLSVQRLHGLLGPLPPSIFRVKGIVNLAEKPDHPCVLQAAGKRAALTVGQLWGEGTPRSQIVFIGTRGGVDREWLMKQLSGKQVPQIDITENSFK